MKAAELTKQMEAGRSYLLGAFVSDEIRSGTSATTGKPYTMHTAYVLVGTDSLEISLEVPPGAAPAKCQVPRYSPVAVELSGPPYSDDKGRVRCRAVVVNRLEA